MDAIYIKSQSNFTIKIQFLNFLLLTKLKHSSEIADINMLGLNNIQ